MQVNVNHSGNTLFNVSGGSSIITTVLIAYFEDQGMIDGFEDREELHGQILGAVVDAAMNKPTNLWVGLYLLTFDK